jgi:hypothetical protein
MFEIFLDWNDFIAVRVQECFVKLKNYKTVIAYSGLMCVQNFTKLSELT